MDTRSAPRRLRFHFVAWPHVRGLSARVDPAVWRDTARAAVLHKCDNPPCCNPWYLRLGTDAYNRADKMRRGRQPRGDKSGMRTHPESRPYGERHLAAKLTDAQVVAIRALFAEGGHAHV